MMFLHDDLGAWFKHGPYKTLKKHKILVVSLFLVSFSVEDVSDQKQKVRE